MRVYFTVVDATTLEMRYERATNDFATRMIEKSSQNRTGYNTTANNSGMFTLYTPKFKHNFQRVDVRNPDDSVQFATDDALATYLIDKIQT